MILKTNDQSQWNQAMQEKINSLLEKKTWNLVYIPTKANKIDLK